MTNSNTLFMTTEDLTILMGDLLIDFQASICKQEKMAIANKMAKVERLRDFKSWGK